MTVNIFKNYVRNPETATPINLAAARIILTVYLIWVILSVNWGLAAEYPRTNANPNVTHLSPFVPDIILQNATILMFITVIFLVLFGVGIHIRITALLSSFLVSYFGLIRFHADGTWSTHMFFAASILLMLFALYSEQDRLSIDGLRDVSKNGIDELNNHLNQPTVFPFRSTPLQIFAISLGILYFGSGLSKIVVGGPQWISSTNLGRHMYRPIQVGYAPEIRDLVAQIDSLLLLLAFGTIVLELGFIMSILIDRLFSLFVISLMGFHVGIALLMGPVFLYTLVFLLLLTDWEGILSRIKPEEYFLIYYDHQSPREVSALYFFIYLDVNQSIEIKPHSLSDGQHTSDNTNDHQALTLVTRDRVLKGYDAYRFLCHNSRILYPVFLIMGIPGIATIYKNS